MILSFTPIQFIVLLILGVMLMTLESVLLTLALIFIRRMNNKPKNTAESVHDERDSLLAKYYNQIGKIANEARESIISLLKENNLTSVNFLPYRQKSYIDNYLFVFFDKNGHGAALGLDSLTYENEKVMFSMSENENGYYGQCSLNELPAIECVHALEMLSGVIKYSKEKGIPVLTENQDFDDVEQE